MSFPDVMENSGQAGSWGKTNLIGPCAVYFTVGTVHTITGGLNPVSGLMMGIASSIVDIVAGIITNGSTKDEDMYFRLAATSLIPLSMGMCLGLTLTTALVMSIINLGTRVILNEYVFDVNLSQ
ncbi:MAG: hypothetical protein K940chlam3_00535 [Chlamydiae bacterium]|nr:hypothetical protein [Chlamydiota bacterium]